MAVAEKRGTRVVAEGSEAQPSALAAPRLVRVGELRPWDENPRSISPARFENLRRALAADPEFLRLRPILARKSDGLIYCGNQRYLAAIANGATHVPAIVEDVDERTMRERAIRDNEQWGEWSDDLGPMLRALEGSGSDLGTLGLEDYHVERLLAAALREEGTPEEVDLTPPETATIKVGQLYELGPHRLICLWPLAWLPARQLVGAVEMRQLGPVANYIVVRSGAIERTPVNPSPGVASFSASRDGARVVVSLETSVRWWPTDHPTAAKEFTAQGTERFGHVEFRPGTDELGVDVGSAFEIWTLTGQRRVVAERTPGFLRWRVDGSAAIASSDPSSVWLVDPATGAKTQLPGSGFPVSDVVMFDTPR